ncbi:hypothetical protein EZS27_032605, partial [termite gut metagenome]
FGKAKLSPCGIDAQREENIAHVVVEYIKDVKEDEEPEPTKKEKKSFLNRLRSFFVRAPQDGAALDW